MKISGFTIVRNGSLYDYPYIESIKSLLPVVDELIVAVGLGEDDTLEQVRALAATHPKIKILETKWELGPEELRRGGKILAQQTNLALAQCTGDWCIYLQADEVLHEHDYPILKSSLERAHSNSAIEAVVFNYIHFYGSFDVVQFSRSSYRREVRAIKRTAQAESVGDAQGFRKKSGQKLNAILSQARVFHYGWVRPPEKMKQKTEFMDSLYHGNSGHTTGDNYRYKRIWGLMPFKGSHPLVMKDRIKAKNWSFEYQKLPLEWHLSDVTKVTLDLIERATGVRLFEYRSYKL